MYLSRFAPTPPLSPQFVRVLQNMAKDLGFFSIAWTILILAFRHSRTTLSPYFRSMSKIERPMLHSCSLSSFLS
jgi:hypothetical protein